MTQTLDDLVNGLRGKKAYQRLVKIAQAGSLNPDISSILLSSEFKDIFLSSDDELSKTIGEVINPKLKVSTSYNLASKIISMNISIKETTYSNTKENDKPSETQISCAEVTDLDTGKSTLVCKVKPKKSTESKIYDCQKGPPQTNIQIDSQTALVITDPQKDFLEPDGLTWKVVGSSVLSNNTTEHIRQLLKAAKAKNMLVFISPHFYYPTDRQWNFMGGLEKLMHDIDMFNVKNPVDFGSLSGSGADFMDVFKPYILDGETIIVSPHKIYGPSNNDLVLQLRKRGVNKVILAGMSANLCLESHMRELLEQGFEVGVVSDATAGGQFCDHNGVKMDGYQAALTNFHFMANDVWTTQEILKLIK